MKCVDNKAWCIGPEGEPGYGRRKCLVCAKVAAKLKSEPAVSSGATPSSPAMKSTPVKVKTVAPVKPITLVKPAAPTQVEKPLLKPLETGSSSQKSQVDNELALLRLAQEARRTPPPALGIKYPYAYRGVGSNPNVYRKRGGFLPHLIKNLELAQSSLKNLANTPAAPLRTVAYNWQVKKDKEDGYFLSTGLNSKDAYDTYPFLYRFDTRGLHIRNWDEVGFPYQAECVGNCFLYTDNADLARSTMIAVICLEQGPGRIYELLVMSPVEPRNCEVEDPPGSKQYISFDAWSKLHGTGDNAKSTDKA